jgi:hypothetical protein
MRLLFAILLTALAHPVIAQTTRFALTGDSIINRRQSVVEDPEYLQLITRIREADAAFTNLETLIHNFEYSPAAESGGVYMTSPPWITGELKWLGFDLFSTANNHSVDYGAEGLLSTLRYLDEAGLTHAGTGENLARARAPGYLDTRRGRVALIAVTSTFPAFGLAGEQRNDLKGRPGVNPLRFTVTYGVSKEVIDGLRKLPGPGRARAEGGPLRLLGATFVESATPSITAKPLDGDIAALTRSIRGAKRQADWVIVSFHGHEGGNGGRTRPADFHVAFAHAAIEAGADIIVGHGPHVLRGVEIYKGKPILYGLGNFFFENESVEFLPSENYNQLGLEPSSLPSEFYDRRSRNDTAGFPADQENWEGALAEVIFDGQATLSEVRIVPVTLGYKQPRTKRGRPRLADPTDARRILERIQELSKSLGSNLEITGNTGRILPAPVDR